MEGVTVTAHQAPGIHITPRTHRHHGFCKPEVKNSPVTHRSGRSYSRDLGCLQEGTKVAGSQSHPWIML